MTKVRAMSVIVPNSRPMIRYLILVLVFCTVIHWAADQANVVIHIHKL